MLSGFYHRGGEGDKKEHRKLGGDGCVYRLDCGNCFTVVPEGSPGPGGIS